jgi:hypothetical protein
MGKPIATSVLALSRESNTASAAWTTMKLVALCALATSRTARCSAAGQSSATVAPR